MSADFCQNQLSIANVLNMQIFPTSDPSETPITVELGNLQKYNYFGNFEMDTVVTQDDLKAITVPTFNAGDGSCDNFALEVNMKFEFEETVDTPASFTIKKATADIVYGKIVPATPTTPVRIARKTSLQFI